MLVLITAPAANKSLGFYEAYKYGIHAEKSAIMSVKNKSVLKHSKIYIIKLNNNKIEQATPCCKCEKLLTKYRLTVHYIKN